jgi:hypothetical protein
MKPVFLSRLIFKILFFNYIDISKFKNNIFNNSKKNLISFQKLIIFIKNKSLRFLKRFYVLAFRKFKLRPKLKRRYINVRVKDELVSLKRKIKRFTKRLLFFIKDTQVFLNLDFCTTYLKEESFKKLKNLLFLDFTKTLKNRELLSWLRVIITYFP